MSFLVAPPMFSNRGTSLINTLKNLGLTTNLRVCLDAGDVNSYDGSSQTWKDLSGGGYDFYRGSGSGSDSADPTFNGTAGKLSSGEYFSYDGGDYFTLAQSNPAWVNSFHKAGAKFTILQWGYLNGITSLTPDAMALGDFPINGVGMQLGLSSSTLRALEFVVSAGGSFPLDLNSTATLNNNAWNFAGLSVDITAGNVIFQINGTTETHTGRSYSSPSSSDAGATLQLGSLGGNDTPDASGCRLAASMFWDVALSGANLLALYNATKTRFGL